VPGHDVDLEAIGGIDYARAGLRKSFVPLLLTRKMFLNPRRQSLDLLETVLGHLSDGLVAKVGEVVGMVLFAGGLEPLTKQVGIQLGECGTEVLAYQIQVGGAKGHGKKA